MELLIELLIDATLLVLLVATAVVAIRLRDLFAVAGLLAIYSFTIAGLFMDLDAVDVAFTEAAVGAGVTTVFVLASLHLTGRFEKPRNPRKIGFALIVVGVTGAALVYGTLDAPVLGDPQAPAHQHVAVRYIEQTQTEIGIPNMVTAVLASYRGYDTLGETLVIFVAGVGVLSILGINSAPKRRPGRDQFSHHLVLRVVCKFLMPFILLFALYVQFHSDFGAGGGFQAGVIFAAGWVLYDLVFGERDTRVGLPDHWLRRLAAVGVLLYAGTGVVAMLKGHSFLNHSVLLDSSDAGTHAVAGQHLGIFLVELGVGVTVFAVMMSIFYALSGRRSLP